MRKDNLEQFVKLRRELTQEKEYLSQRLSQINEALGDLSAEVSTSGPDSSEEAGEFRRPLQAARRGRKPAGGGASLREHVIEVLQAGPLTSRDVLAAVQKRGYRFSTKNPLNSLGVILYGKNPKFDRADGKFSLGGGGAVSKSSSTHNGEREMSPRQRKGVPRRRQISAAGRKAIADAARKRWAAAKRAGKNSL